MKIVKNVQISPTVRLKKFELKILYRKQQVIFSLCGQNLQKVENITKIKIQAFFLKKSSELASSGISSTSL